MKRCYRHHAWAVLLVVGGIASAGADEVDSESWLGDGQPGQAEAWRSNGYRSSATQVVFQPLADTRIAALKRSNAAVGNRRLQVGVSRQLASEAIRSDLAGLAWVAVEGGSVVLVDIVSPGAKGLRVALKPSSLPPATQIRVAGDDGVILVTSADKAGSLVDGYGLFWTAVTAGERQRLEFFMPAGIDTAGTVPDIRAAAHLLVSMGAPGGFPLGAVTLSQPCQINAVCPDDELGQAYVNARNAVGWMNFMAGGESSVCTGTLLADMDTSTTIPWFYSAHHCISSQADANTLTTFWRREASTCDGTDEGDAIQVDGGAQLVYATSNTDAALFRLNAMPPVGSTFSGWTSAAMVPDTDILGIHHPDGDIKKVSFGRFLARDTNTAIGDQAVNSALRVTWLQGVTEGGSSGSGLLTRGNNGYQLRGGLFGGSSQCDQNGDPDNPENSDLYSDFAAVYPAISQYIGNPGGGGQNGPTRNYTGQWSAPAEAGRGLSLFQFPNVLFGLWFVYDDEGRASWYQLDPAWTGRDVASGRVVRWTGSPWAPSYDPNVRTFVEVGNFTLTFTSATAATFAYNVDGVNRSTTFSKL